MMDDQKSEKTERALIREGVFRARPVEGELTETQGGDPQYAVRFLLLEGPDAGKHLGWWGGFKGKGLKYTPEALEALGWDRKQSLAAWKPSKEATITVEHDEIPATKDKPKRPVARVKYVNPLDGGGMGALVRNKLSDAQKKTVADDLMARLAAMGGVATAPEPVAPESIIGADDDDTIPF